jgi:hypothetical protein
MSKFFSLFPLRSYSLSDETYKGYELVTDIFLRFGIIKNVINNISAYYEYTITDNDKPEILAEKVYGSPEAYWIILYANDMIDPQYDWPLNGKDFDNYIIGKYGSIANSKTTIHHYEKVISRTENISGIKSEYRYTVDYEPKANNNIQVPYDYYTNLPETQSVETIEIGGKTITQITSREEISNYDYEWEKNNNKRFVKIIKPVYYGSIMKELQFITGNQTSFYRGL